MAGVALPKRFWYAKIMISLFLIGLLYLLADNYERAELIYNGHENAGIQKYYLIAVAGIAFWSAVLFLGHETQLALVLITKSIVFALYLIEVTVFLTLPFSASQALKAKDLGIYFDARSKQEVINEFQDRGVDAVTSVHPWALINDADFLKSTTPPLLPLGGIANKTVVHCNESGHYAIYQSDRFGFNNPDDVWEEKSADWFLIGDSFVHGACVPEGSDIASQIRLQTGSHVINVGSSGNGPLIELATLTEYAEGQKPKRVLWFYYEGNDLERNLRKEKKSRVLMQYLRSDFSQRLREKQPEIDALLLNYISQTEHLQKSVDYGRLLRLFHLRERLGLNRLVVNIEPLFVEIMSHARDRVRKWGGELYFVYVPEFYRYSGGVEDHDGYRKRKVVIDTVKALGIPVVDLHQDFFSNHSEPLSFFPLKMARHYTADGYQQVAKTVVSQIKLLSRH